MGLNVFWRRHSEIGLTPAGQAYAEQVLRALTLIEHETRRMVQIANPKQLRIRTGPTFAHCWLAPRLAQFCAENPQTDLLVTTNVGEIDLSEDHFDVAIYMLRNPRPDGSQELLFEFSIIMAVCHPSRPLRQPKDLAKQVLLHSLNRMTYWSQWFQAAGIKNDNCQAGPKFKSSVLAYEAAKGDLGIVCAEVEFIRADIEAGRLRAPFDIQVATHDGFYLSVEPYKADIGSIRAFRDWLLRETSHIRTHQDAYLDGPKASA